MKEFESIFKEFTPVVFRFLLSLCMDESLAEELTSETFYQAYLHIGQFRGDCKIETWLCQIAKNALYKEQKRRERIAQGNYPEDLTTESNLFEAVSNKEQALQIHKHLHLLKEPLTVFSACILSLCFLTVKDMYAQADPIIPETEDGVYNLTDNALETTAEDIDQYVFYTNTTEIGVSVHGKKNVSGSVMLWNVADDTDWIQMVNIEDNGASCTFTNLSASQRYKITCNGLDNSIITVHENRKISFWHSLKNVLTEILWQCVR